LCPFSSVSSVLVFQLIEGSRLFSYVVGSRLDGESVRASLVVFKNSNADLGRSAAGWRSASL
jgi:hypothetical protein